jgi:hypothetical protein
MENIVEHLIKYKVIALVGMWLGLGMLGFNAGDDAKGMLAVIGMFTSFLILVWGNEIRG